MSQKCKLKNMKWDSYQEVKSIVEQILINVSKAIDAREASEEIVLDMVEDAMDLSDEKVKRKSERETKTACLRHDLKVLDYRRNLLVFITNPINGNEYSVSLKRSDMPQLERAGYVIKDMNPGTTRHLYAALRATVPDIGRSTSIRIWFTTNTGLNVTVPANELPVVNILDQKLFMTKLRG